ncbi:sensor histidine kinase [Serpentinicella sp. ANB-PHB4]|uniref:sensor histidine kinase n=1 Tax=Serpentinicella sp. ANB-PHB4 TaxID=3074076 RepID=UPI00285ED027|nr:sensor histidine kinase [Serpentinicella sp. ANB-PHB4]MDR5657944.1 sensor histidine kinase [Serpentinicella sp. ANB-PHB4]
MKTTIINSEKMNEILQKVTIAIDESKKEVFDIAESARKEYNDIKNELNELQQSVLNLINDVDKLELLEKKSRKKLLEVSKNFMHFTEKDIREAYEQANELQVSLVLKKEQEKDLINKRTELEKRLKNATRTLSKAEGLTSKMGIVLEFLSGNLQDITNTLEDIQQKHVVAKRIIEAQEAERQRIARDIHDGPAQSLSNVVIKSEVCEKLMVLDPGKAKQEIVDLKSSLRETIKDIRKIIYNLRPMSLDDLGFIPTVQQYVKNFEEETKTEVDFMILSQEGWEDSEISLCIFRVIQEALSNIRKHAEASLVKIKMEMSKSYIAVSIFDNGKGFDLKSEKTKEKIDSGFGLMSMEERVKLLNGNLEIKSGINKGTKIIIRVSKD